MTALLALKDVNAYYGKLQALKGISASVAKGEIVTIVGANGAGKSTLLKAICGFIEVRQGTITFNDRDITNGKTESLAGMGIALVPEGRQIFTELTVEDNLLLGAACHLRRTTRSDLAARFDSVFSIFPRLAERKKQLGGTLSGGEQQMLAVGRALMSRPSLLLLDEPSMGLAPFFVREIFSVIKKLNEEGTSVLLIEQNVKSALETANRGYVLQNGKVMMEDESSKLLQNSEVQRMYLGEENV